MNIETFIIEIPNSRLFIMLKVTYAVILETVHRRCICYRESSFHNPHGIMKHKVKMPFGILSLLFYHALHGKNWIPYHAIHLRCMLYGMTIFVYYQHL